MATEQTIIDLTQNLLDAIVRGDWQTYTQLCHPELTAFEPEALGHLVAGMPFHKFYFPDKPSKATVQVTISQPKVWLSDAMAVIAYVRLTQSIDPQGAPLVRAMEETRVWQHQEGAWRHTHFHRSRPSA
jgi:hypothetical protein